MYNYPAEFPQQAAKNLYDLLSGRSAISTPDALHDAWWLYGYGQSLAVSMFLGVSFRAGTGEPGSVEVRCALKSFRANSPKLTDEQALHILGSLAGVRKCPLRISAEIVGDDARSKGLKDRLMLMLLPILSKWLQDWLKNGGLEKLIGQLAENTGS